MRSIHPSIVAAALAATGSPACTDDPAEPEPVRAVANISPTQGNQVRGTVEFTEDDGLVRITATLTGLTEGDHGFHVHERGDCSAADGTSAGGHFNPENKAHGSPDAAERHVGDLGNVNAGANGGASYNRLDTHVAFAGTRNILGLAVIVHERPDDFSQPTGAAGARLGCGVIERS